jgi:hypothetical protein
MKIRITYSILGIAIGLFIMKSRYSDFVEPEIMENVIYLASQSHLKGCLEVKHDVQVCINNSLKHEREIRAILNP